MRIEIKKLQFILFKLRHPYKVNHDDERIIIKERFSIALTTLLLLYTIFSLFWFLIRTIMWLWHCWSNISLVVLEHSLFRPLSSCHIIIAPINQTTISRHMAVYRSKFNSALFECCARVRNASIWGVMGPYMQCI